MIPSGISFNNQSVVNQSNQGQFSFSIKPQESVYEQYLKSLEVEIGSREKQRQEIQKAFEQLQKQYRATWDQLVQQRKKCQQILTKLQQTQSKYRELQDKKRTLHNEKQVLSKQYQYEMQKNRILQGNEMKLRSSYEMLQKTYESLQVHQEKVKSDYEMKVNQSMDVIGKLQEQLVGLRNGNFQLEERVKGLEGVNKGLKEQIEASLIQRNKIVESLTRDKAFFQKQYQNQHKQHTQTRAIASQRQQTIKQLNKQVNKLEKQHQMQKDKFNYKISQLTFQNNSLVKQGETIKAQLKRQTELLNIQNTQLRISLGQFEKQKKVDLVHNEQLHKGLDRLQKQVTSLVESKLYCERQKETMKQGYEEEILRQREKYQKLQQEYSQKCMVYENVHRQLMMVSRELDISREESGKRIQGLRGQVEEMRVLFSQQSTEASQYINKLLRQKQLLIQELSKEKVNYYQKLKDQQRHYLYEGEMKENQIKKYYQTQITHLNSNISMLNRDLTKLTQEMLHNNQLHINQINKLSLKYQEKLSNLSVLQQGSAKQLETHFNEQLNHQIKAIKSLGDKINEKQLENHQISQKFINLQKNYEIIQSSSKIEITKLNTTLSSKQTQIYQLEQKLQQIKSTLNKDKHSLKQQNHLLKNQLQQIITNIQTFLELLPKLKQNSLKNINPHPFSSSLSILSSLKTFIFTLTNQNTSLNSQLSSNQQAHSSLLTQKHHSSKAYDSKIIQLQKNIQKQIKKSQQLNKTLTQIHSSIQSVVEFAQKYSGQQISKNQETPDYVNQQIDDNSRVKKYYMRTKMESQDDVENDQQSWLGILEVSKAYCQSLSTFIGERLYVISIFMQQSTQMKQDLQAKFLEIQTLQHKLSEEQRKYQQLLNEHSFKTKQLQTTKQDLLNTNKQNTQSISSLKQHISNYKSQLDKYESQIQQIMLKVQEHQMKDLTSMRQIALLQAQIRNIKHENESLQKQFQEQCKEILKLSAEMEKKNHQILNFLKQTNIRKEEMEKQSHQHILDIQALKMKHFNQLQHIQQSTSTQKKTLKLSSQTIVNKLHQQSIIQKQKTKHLQKLLQTKTLQYTQLQTHFQLTLKTQQSTHQNEITSLQNQLKYLQSKSHSPSKEIMRNKIANLQAHVQTLEKELKVVSENNTLLRKNYVSALEEKQALREEVKLNKSQRSDSKNHSKDRNVSQQFKNKYLTKKNTQRRNTNPIQSHLSQSLGTRSYSNSNINSTQSQRRFQSPRDSSTKMSSQNYTQPNNHTIQQPNYQQKSPISNFHRSTPHIPLDLKKIRQRNQKYFVSQGDQVIKETSSITVQKPYVKPQLYLNKLNEDELPSMVSPVKFLDEPDNSY